MQMNAAATIDVQDRVKPIPAIRQAQAVVLASARMRFDQCITIRKTPPQFSEHSP